MDPRSTVPSAAATSDDLQSSGGIASSSSSPADAVARISHPLSQRQQHLLDKTVPHVLYRWISCLAVVLVYAVPVYFVEGFYIITYSIGIYILSLLIAFHSPQEDLEASIGGGGLPTRRSDEFRPFIRRLPEFKFWFVCFPLNYDPSVYCILVMRDGMIVQSGKYDELVSSGLDFVELVAAHETSMELVEASSTSAAAANVPTQRSISIEPPRHPHRRVSIESPRHQPTTPNSPIINRTTSMESPRMQRTTSMDSPCLGELNDESIKSFLGANIPEDGSRLIKEEERAVGQVSFQVYKLYLTEAYGWWGIILVLFFSLAWQGSIMASDYWLPYETSAKREVSFDASVFIRIYLIIAAISIVLVCCRAFYITHLGLKTSQIFLPLNLS